MDDTTPPVAPDTRRRRSLGWAAGLALLAGGLAGAGQAAAQRAGISRLGVFSLLGDGLQIAVPGAMTDTRLDRTLRETLPTREIGFDQQALRAVTEVMARERPQAQLQMFRATTPLAMAEQRLVADGAARAELPAWIIEAINSARLSHVLLLTRARGEAAFRVEDGFTVGRGVIEGIGFYLDSDTDLKNRETGRPSQGFLGAYAYIRVQLMDATSGNIVGSHDIRASEVHAGRADTEAENVWNALTPTEKVDVLRELVRSNVQRVMPLVLART